MLAKTFNHHTDGLFFVSRKLSSQDANQCKDMQDPYVNISEEVYDLKTILNSCKLKINKILLAVQCF